MTCAPRPEKSAGVRPTNAFTLLELMAVLLVTAIIGGAIAANPSLWRATGVTAAGNLVMDDFDFARQLSIAGNFPTEVWLLKPTGGTFANALQIYTVDQSGNATSYGGVHRLRAGVGIDTGTYLSPFCSTGNVKQWIAPQVQPSIPGYQTSYAAWYVRFMPDGTTTLTTSSHWYITVHDVSLGDQLAALPKNFASVRIDPVTGAVSIYRP